MHDNNPSLQFNFSIAGFNVRPNFYNIPIKGISATRVYVQHSNFDCSASLFLFKAAAASIYEAGSPLNSFKLDKWPEEREGERSKVVRAIRGGPKIEREREKLPLAMRSAVQRGVE